MATYNGAKYLKEQLDSIVPYMNCCDELIISDDGSNDGTLDIIKNYTCQYDNITLIRGPQKGLIRNFENALFYSKNDIILFSDQDDIWMPEKLPIIRKFFEDNTNIDVAHHDKYICNNEQIARYDYGVFLKESSRWKHGVLQNLIFSCYYGCCMAIRRDFMLQLLPFPPHTIAYDQLVGAIAEYKRSAAFIFQPLIVRRIHGENQSRKRGLWERIRFRFMNIWAFLEALYE